MGTHYGPRPGLTTSGLIHYFDAGNPNSYSGTGNTWIDLSGNNNATLVASPAYTSNGVRSYFTFSSASSQYASVSGSRTLSAATFIVWLYRSGSQLNYTGILFSRGGGGNASGLDFFGTTNNLGYHWNDANNTYQWNSGLTVPDLQWSMCALSVSASSATAYLYQNSGISTATNNVSHSSSILSGLEIGRDAFQTRYFNGRIGVAQLYNTNLTQAQITQNFYALRNRYLT